MSDSNFDINQFSIEYCRLIDLSAIYNILSPNPTLKEKLAILVSKYDIKLREADCKDPLYEVTYSKGNFNDQLNRVNAFIDEAETLIEEFQ